MILGLDDDQIQKLEMILVGEASAGRSRLFGGAG
jgi:hypothetical protein